MSTTTTEAQSTGLMRSTSGNSNGHGLSVFDRIDNPLAFIESMGKTYAQAGVAGCKSEADGRCMVLACLSQKKDPFALTAEYHLIDGKLSKKADQMLAQFDAAGGEHTWLKDGDDGISAELELIDGKGKKLISSYSFEDAKEAGLLKGGSRWTKGKKAIGEMLRARCTSRGVRMLMPGLIAGTYTPEELEDDGPAREVKPSRSKAEVEKRREELQQQNATVDSVVDAEVSSVSATEEAPFDGQEAAGESSAPTTSQPEDRDPNYNEHTTVLFEIEATIGQIGLTKEQLIAGLKAKNPGFNSLDDLPLDKAKAMLENLRAAAAKK